MWGVVTNWTIGDLFRRLLTTQKETKREKATRPSVSRQNGRRRRGGEGGGGGVQQVRGFRRLVSLTFSFPLLHFDVKFKEGLEKFIERGESCFVLFCFVLMCVFLTGESRPKFVMSCLMSTFLHF